MAKTLNAECPTCKTPLPVVVDKQSIVRVAICDSCGDEYQYSAWDLPNNKIVGVQLTKVELEKIASGHVKGGARFGTRRPDDQPCPGA